MESFEITVGEESFRIIRSSVDIATFSVFNYATFHLIRKDNLGEYISIEHRFGTDKIPLNEIGEAIDHHYSPISSKKDLA